MSKRVVAIGVFDGVHRGHQEILNRAKEIADGGSVIALTFDPHPATVFAPERAPKSLVTLADRVVLLKIHGADQVAVMKFDEKFAAMSPEDFVNQILIKQLEAGDLIVGENFTYGHKAAGNIETLKAHQEFKVHVLELHSDDTEPVSSTRIRTAITNGDVETARLLLSRPHRLDGVVVHGEARGREIGYPTANLGNLDGQTIPADGIYAG